MLTKMLQAIRERLGPPTEEQLNQRRYNEALKDHARLRVMLAERFVRDLTATEDLDPGGHRRWDDAD